MAENINENQSIGSPFVGEIDYNEIEKIMVNFTEIFSGIFTCIDHRKIFKLDFFNGLGRGKRCVRDGIQSKMER